jgi:hypothetical protein
MLAALLANEALAAKIYGDETKDALALEVMIRES